jgi:hypothetical protein
MSRRISLGLTPQELCAAQSLFVREILTHGQVLFDSGCIAKAQKKLKASRRL